MNRRNFTCRQYRMGTGTRWSLWSPLPLLKFTRSPLYCLQASSSVLLSCCSLIICSTSYRNRWQYCGKYYMNRNISISTHKCVSFSLAPFKMSSMFMCFRLNISGGVESLVLPFSEKFENAVKSRCKLPCSM